MPQLYYKFVATITFVRLESADLEGSASNPRSR